MSKTYKAAYSVNVQQPGHLYIAGEFSRVLATIGVTIITVTTSVHEGQGMFGFCVLCVSMGIQAEVYIAVYLT